MMIFVFFFFSSRRRHTRWTGDWSSDVCSSDLEKRGEGAQRFAAGARVGVAWLYRTDGTCEYCRSGAENRSEERRVGKECRSRWSPEHEKKKKKEHRV